MEVNTIQLMREFLFHSMTIEMNTAPCHAQLKEVENDQFSDAPSDRLVRLDISKRCLAPTFLTLA